VYRHRVNDEEHHGLVRRPREGLLDTGFQQMATIDHLFHFADGTHGIEGRIATQGFPITVVGDETGSVLRHLLVEQLLHGQREGVEHLALLYRRDALEGVDMVGMNRKQVTPNWRKSDFSSSRYLKWSQSLLLQV